MKNTTERPGHYDVAILGSGFGGSILARALRRQKKKVLLLERGRHPRFALGESATPLASLSLERLAARYRLPDLHDLAAYGRWLEHLPHLRRGLKRGFTFFAHQRGKPYSNSVFNEHRLMVAASPNDAVADAHWLRRDVDDHLVRRAIDEGVDYFDRTVVEDLEVTDRGVHLVAHAEESGLHHFSADFLVDATGPGGALARKLEIASRADRIPFSTALLFGHFENLEPFGSAAALGGGEVHLGDGPYPEEKAAVHHLLHGGWMYVLPFDHGVASVGFVLRHDALPGSFEQMALDPEKAMRQLLAQYPTLEAQFRGARALVGPTFVPRIQHRLVRAAGPRYFLLPHAFAFYDPLFSTGIAWTLLAVERLATLLDGRYGDYKEYNQLLQQEADQIETLIEAAWLAMDDFQHFKGVALLYFAAASFAETQQRLHQSSAARPDAWQGFLGAGDPVLRSLFFQARDRLKSAKSPLAPRGARDFTPWVLERIAPRDLCGFDRPKMPNLYPVDLELLVERAELLAMEPAEVFAALPRLRGST